jgi:hypothetical protein
MKANGRCELCGEKGTERHHIFFGPVSWLLRYNPDFYILLCLNEHSEQGNAPHAAHKDNKAFMAVLEAKFRITQPKRLQAILEAYNAPRRTPPKADWNVLHQALTETYKNLEETCWMDNF